MATRQVDIPSIGLVTLYKRKGNRSIRLSIAPDGEIRVTMPSWIPFKAGEEFARSRANWISEHRETRKTVGAIEHGQRIGKNHRIYFDKSDRATIASRVYNTEIYVLHPLGTEATDPKIQQKAQSASIKALRLEAERLLPPRLQQLAVDHGFSYRSVGVKQLKSRWGSCSSLQEITLNLYLMQLPWYLIDYVLLHELTHTKHMEHGSAFWTELERHLPNAKGLRNEINTYQPILSPKPSSMA